jgi:hypothetical protein
LLKQILSPTNNSETSSPYATQLVVDPELIVRGSTSHLHLNSKKLSNGKKSSSRA